MKVPYFGVSGTGAFFGLLSLLVEKYTIGLFGQ